MGWPRRQPRPVPPARRPGRRRSRRNGRRRRGQRPSPALHPHTRPIAQPSPPTMRAAAMPVADLSLPSRLLAGGGPGSPDPRVLRSLCTPLIGQFDPDFTAIMDEVMAAARAAFLTANVRCFPVSGLAAAGLEALLNTLVTAGDRVAIGGGPRFVAETADIARRLGAEVQPADALSPGTRLLVVPAIDPTSGHAFPIQNLAAGCHAARARLIVDATFG